MELQKPSALAAGPATDRSTFPTADDASPHSLDTAFGNSSAFQRRLMDQLSEITELISSNLEWPSEKSTESGAEKDRAQLIERRICDLNRLLANYFHSIIEKRDLGRELVEERARNRAAARQLNEAARRADLAESLSFDLGERLRASEDRLQMAKSDIERRDNEMRNLSVRFEENSENILIPAANVRLLSQAIGDVRETVQSLVASRLLKATKLLGGAPLVAARRALSQLINAEQALTQIHVGAERLQQVRLNPSNTRPL